MFTKSRKEQAAMLVTGPQKLSNNLPTNEKGQDTALVITGVQARAAAESTAGQLDEGSVNQAPRAHEQGERLAMDQLPIVPPPIERLQGERQTEVASSVSSESVSSAGRPSIDTQTGQPMTWSSLLTNARKWRILRTKRGCSPRDAAVELYKRIQADCFPKELEHLRTGKRVPRQSKIRDKVPYLDDFGVIRLKSQIQNQACEIRNPVVMDAQHAWVRLLIEHLHRAYHHMRETNLKHMIETTYKIYGLRSVLKSVIRNCYSCQASRPRGVKVPAGPLPIFRTERGVAFKSIGVNFAGPDWVKAANNPKELEKRWLFVATCATTRAVHLELVQRMDTMSVWEAYRRVVSRRGHPSTVYSDNGTQLVKASKVLQQLCNFFSKRPEPLPDWVSPHTVWKFSSTQAPWQGGFFERLIREVKVILGTVTRKNHLTESGLITLLCEAECIINSRPIGILEDGGSLTPSHFTSGRRIAAFPPLRRSEVQQAEDLAKDWNKRLRATSSFWRAWVRSYLCQLRGRFCEPSHYTQLKVGDLVLINTPNVSSMEWPEARVTATLPGVDGVVRNVVVKCGNFETRKDVKSLCLLETTQ